MIEYIVSGFLFGSCVGGFAGYHLGYLSRIEETREITAARQAKIEAYELLLTNSKTKREL